MAKGIILGNYLWPCKGQVSWLDGGLPHLRDRRVCRVRDIRQSLAMSTSVIVNIKAVPASTIQEVEELARELGPANAIVSHQKSSVPVWQIRWRMSRKLSSFCNGIEDNGRGRSIVQELKLCEG